MTRNEESLLKIINSLIAKAESTDNDAERQALLEKADALMLKHAIDEAMLAAATPRDERRKPVNEMFQAVDPYTPHWMTFRMVLHSIAKLHRVRCAMHYNGNATLVGYHEDVQYVKTRFTVVWLHFAKTIDPHWDSRLSWKHNAYNFKVSGTPWTKVEVIANEHGCPWNIKQLREGYRHYCADIGETPRQHTQRPAAYKENFTTAFVRRICARIEEMIQQRDKDTSEAGALVAMKDIGVDVDELFYSLFESLRPVTPEQRAAQEAAWRAAEELKERELQEMLAKMTPKQRAAYDAKQAREEMRNARANARYWREQDKKFDAQGAGAGRASANEVDLDRRSDVNAQSRREL